MAPVLPKDRFFTCDVVAREWATSLDKDLFYFTTGGRMINDLHAFFEENKDEAVAVDVHGRLRGGKGGFGSLLRSFRVNRSTNQLMCRDLNGRRMATLEEEKKLKAWVQKAAEREKVKMEKKKAKLERLKGGTGKHMFDDPDYIQQREEILEKTDDAFDDGLEQFKKMREKQKAKKEVVESSSDSDFDFDDMGQIRKRKKPTKKSEIEEKRMKLEEEENSSESDSENECDPELIDDIKKYFEEKGESTAVEEDEPSCSKAEPVKSPAKEEKKQEPPKRVVPENFDAIDLKEFGGQEELEALGLDHLKHALKERGLKCGGSLQERAARLFSVRDLSASKYPKNLLAAAPKK